jgi:UDP-N-acetylglucosamine acyltransferase
MSIHPAAVIDPGARLGAGILIGPHAVIEADTEIGEGCEIRAHAVIKRFTRMGRENVVHEGAVLGGEPQDLAFKGGASSLAIGDRNKIREGVTIHRGTEPGSTTVVGSDCFLMAYSHVAHNDRLGDGVILANGALLAGHIDIGDRAFLSGGVVVHQFCRVGRLAMVGGNSRIPMDCLPFVNTTGIPARALGLNVVGLRRAGIDASGLRTLKQAYRILLLSKLPLTEALEQMAALGNPLVEEMIAFIRASKRGFHRAERPKEAAAE